MKKLKNFWSKFIKALQERLLLIIHFLKIRLKEIVAILILITYVTVTYLIWWAFKDEFKIKESITIQIQFTALLIGLIAATIGLFNFWRKTGVSLSVAIKSGTTQYSISVKNLKDKEIVIYSLYVDLVISDQLYVLDLLKSAENFEGPLIIKAYGSEVLKLQLPTAIRIETYNSEISEPHEYIYIKPIRRKQVFELAKYNNAVFTALKNINGLTYRADTSGGPFSSITQVTTDQQIDKKLVFRDRQQMNQDYISYRTRNYIVKGEGSLPDPDNIEDSDVDAFIRDNETTGPINKAEFQLRL